MQLVRCFVEQSWKIPRPEDIITVTGGGAHFDLPQVDKDKIMCGMMGPSSKAGADYNSCWPPLHTQIMPRLCLLS